MQPTEDIPQPTLQNLTELKPQWKSNDSWQIIIITEGGGPKNSKRKGIAYIGKNHSGQTVLAGCQSIRLKDNKIAKTTSVYEVASKAVSLGFTNIIILVDNKELENMWNNNYPHTGQLHPIFEDLLQLKLQGGMQLSIKAVPHLILAETKEMALAACNHFVNVSSISSGLCM